MDGLHITKYAKRGAVGIVTAPVLLAQGEGLEIMRQTILAGATLWVTPAATADTLEFFCLLSGALTMTLDDQEMELTAGDSFYVENIREEVFLRAKAETELLYITNSPLYELVNSFQGDLDKLLREINDKDQITYVHSKQVMKYSIELFRRMPAERKGISADEMVTAALFHDVGKCFLPDEVLKKKDRLDPDEWRYIIKHPHHSARLLRPRFGGKVAEIAQNHHERLDGSGYPFGLCGDEISFEAKIVAVADVFDAMTTDRGYNQVLSPRQAAKELCQLKEQFDERITHVLADLVWEDTFSSNS